MSTHQTAPVVLEPAAQEFADATSSPPFICDEAMQRRRVRRRRSSNRRMCESGANDGKAKVSSAERVDVGDGGRPECLERSLERRAEFGPRPVVG
jgi:hypothetical protein